MPQQTLQQLKTFFRMTLTIMGLAFFLVFSSLAIDQVSDKQVVEGIPDERVATFEENNDAEGIVRPEVAPVIFANKIFYEGEKPDEKNHEIHAASSRQQDSKATGPQTVKSQAERASENARNPKLNQD